MKFSFIHYGNSSMASYRYRVATPALNLGWAVNDHTADVLIFAKPAPDDIKVAMAAKEYGKTVVADFCDNHFVTQRHYRTMLELADIVTCPTPVMAEYIGSLGKHAHVIIDPYLYEQSPAHCTANTMIQPRILWFGHAVNMHSLKRVFPTIDDYEVRIVTNAPNFIPWTEETVLTEMAQADIVILPATEAYKSNNRALEAIRSGCMVVAEPHPSLNGLPVYVGDIREGIEWTRKNRMYANMMIRDAQEYIMERYSPRTQASAWRTLMKDSNLISDADASNGTAGLAATSTGQTLRVTSVNSRMATSQ